MTDEPVPREPAAAEVVRREAERHELDLAADRRTERRITWRELGCLLLVAGMVAVRQRYLR